MPRISPVLGRKGFKIRRFRFMMEEGLSLDEEKLWHHMH